MQSRIHANFECASAGRGCDCGSRGGPSGSPSGGPLGGPSRAFPTLEHPTFCPLRQPLALVRQEPLGGALPGGRRPAGCGRRWGWGHGRAGRPEPELVSH
eukprot:364962-Chlamydomonas_euryale.AAC.1